jgi:phosphohistidine phosphatase SixA
MINIPSCHVDSDGQLLLKGAEDQSHLHEVAHARMLGIEQRMAALEDENRKLRQELNGHKNMAEQKGWLDLQTFTVRLIFVSKANKENEAPEKNSITQQLDTPQNIAQPLPDGPTGLPENVLTEIRK